MLSPCNGHNASQQQSASKSQQKQQNIRQIKIDSFPSPISDSISPRYKIDPVSPDDNIMKHNQPNSKSTSILSPESKYEELTDDNMDEYEKTVQTIIEMEENLLQSHISFIQVSFIHYLTLKIK